IRDGHVTGVQTCALPISDLPEWRHDKGIPRPEYKGLTRDERTRGMGGLLTSCGEENLLRLEKDRYRGRDICIHEFSHSIRNHGKIGRASCRERVKIVEV